MAFIPYYDLIACLFFKEVSSGGEKVVFEADGTAKYVYWGDNVFAELTPDNMLILRESEDYFNDYFYRSALLRLNEILAQASYYARKKFEVDFEAKARLRRFGNDKKLFLWFNGVAYPFKDRVSISLSDSSLIPPNGYKELYESVKKLQEKCKAPNSSVEKAVYILESKGFDAAEKYLKMAIKKSKRAKKALKPIAVFYNELKNSKEIVDVNGFKLFTFTYRISKWSDKEKEVIVIICKNGIAVLEVRNLFRVYSILRRIQRGKFEEPVNWTDDDDRMFFKWDDSELLDYLKEYVLPNIGDLKFDLIELLPDEVRLQLLCDIL
ncbi:MULTISPECIES: hypothetical protein [unclassified Archaeoglobus]|jgi:hypothetical protein|uniref:hypothetical protein n=1 Tax=unclassified Archaeoglobus TaxID=2643606 RepID=UPI0025C10671|nr:MULTISPECIES: hypothetical protein [unclassified Archaeoglobus]